MGNNLSSDKEVGKRVQEAWENVFISSNQILAQAQRYGFTGLAKVPNPNIHDMLKILREIDTRLSKVLAFLQEEKENSESTEQRASALNNVGKIVEAREQILKMELVAAALAADDKCAFEAAIGKITVAPTHKLFKLG